MSARAQCLRTPHRPWPPGISGDDILLDSLQHFKKLGDVVATKKLDGENTTLYHDYLHARSVDGASQVSRNWLKRFHAAMRYKIPPEMRVCGEYMFAQHSIFYNRLSSYFHVFAIFQNDLSLSSDGTVVWCKNWGLEPAPVLYRGKWNEAQIRAC